MPEIPSFDEYLSTLGSLTIWQDPTVETDETNNIRAAAASLAALDAITLESVAEWVSQNPKWADMLGLAVGLSGEKLKTLLKSRLDSETASKLAKTDPVSLITVLDDACDLLRLISDQRGRTYEFGDVLIARASARGNAATGAAAGRKLENMIEEIVTDLHLPFEMRTRFVGRHNVSAPCDLVIPAGMSQAVIAVAAKVFGSTGSKQTAAFKEIEDMANVRKPTQVVMAVIEGLGWVRRRKDLMRLYGLWANGDIDGMYTVATLDRFRADLEEFARIRKLL
jgi:hypothetical protein